MYTTRDLHMQFQGHRFEASQHMKVITCGTEPVQAELCCIQRWKRKRRCFPVNEHNREHRFITEKPLSNSGTTFCLDHTTFTNHVHIHQIHTLPCRLQIPTEELEASTTGEVTEDERRDPVVTNEVAASPAATVTLAAAPSILVTSLTGPACPENTSRPSSHKGESICLRGHLSHDGHLGQIPF
eukprot:TRINITY_DN109671_c0_g1_i1.p1 TRINITY_DN109671_c0_g1~~TRINITY_DN109671_c0_g1_i1.p1  ORF type:complete len:184 (+),score=21.04 TRINITY_DN109671_c0_g1_i1:821-1372(+)